MDSKSNVDLIVDKLNGWWVIMVKMLPNLILASVIILLSFLLAKWIRSASVKILTRISGSEAIANLISTLLYLLVIIAGLVTALNIMNLDKTVSSLLAGVGIIGLALGFAFQDLTANFIAGVFMAFKRPFEVGHKVETNGFVGKIEHIQLRSTTMITNAGLYVIIPNKEIFQRPIINYSHSKDRRVELELTIPNTIDLSYAEELIRKAIDSAKIENPISDVQYYYTAIDDPKIKLLVSFQIDNQQPRGFMTTRHRAIVSIYKTFAEQHLITVSIPEQSVNKKDGELALSTK